MDVKSTIISSAIIIGVILLWVFWGRFIQIYYKLAKRAEKQFPNMFMLKIPLITMLGIALKWWVDAMNTDWTNIVVATVFILLILYVLWFIEKKSIDRKKELDEQLKKDLSESIAEAVENGIARGITEGMKIVRQKENL